MIKTKPVPQKIRKIVNQKYRNMCVFCDAGKFLHVHHIDTDRNNNSLDNLLLVCRSCHRKCHGHVGLDRYTKEIIEFRRQGYSPLDICTKLNLDWNFRTKVCSIVTREQTKDPTISDDHEKNFRIRFDGEKELIQYL